VAQTQRVAIFPGSFDPITRGHLDVIERARELFDQFVIGVLENPEKNALFSPRERVALIEAELGAGSDVSVLSFRGLTVDFAAEQGARWVVRGVRSASDIAHELPMAHSNRICGRDEIQTVLVPTRPELAFISSSLVRQIALGGGQLSGFVTSGVQAALASKTANPPA